MSAGKDATDGHEPAPAPAPTPELEDIKDLGYEQARDELITIVARLEGGQLGLEESMALWQRGEALAEHCSTWLDAAAAKLEDQTAVQRAD
ncbi:exodeoxyribonuclease VII small subunit [Segeticoccus rhizosphaerae]|jgi:exodeoxyribonuclease VII small subunit|uniref:exodeoxyribonuclease VII small subunit n=1 Tax=Segeticoccus rhizosphaerae TaxID=1104777 RepID=UPI0010BFA9A5|nr:MULTISPECIES: exodeoxyribonuclease VII small subunit [Intrasporangiaceae]